MREYKGITLAQIAAVTKVPSDLFAAFERGDLRRWPRGLFRRAFFRGYATMIGVPVEETCEAFARLFPEEEASATANATVDPKQEEEPARLALDATWHGPRAAFLVRLFATLVDAAVVLASALTISWIARYDRSATIATAALIYYSAGTALFSESPARWAIARRQSIIAAFTQAFASGDASASENVEETEPRKWVTDAYRVGPAPRLRVRLKVHQ